MSTIPRRGLLLGALGVALAAAVTVPAATAGAAACTWTATKLPPLPGSANHAGAVLGTDGAGTYAGYAYAAQAQHAALWRAGAIVDLGQPLGVPAVATDVNRAGTAVGYSQPADGTNISTALVWRGGVATVLPGTDARAAGINDNGIVVGFREDAAGHPVGVVWSVTTATPTVVREYAGVTLSAIGADNRIVGTRYAGVTTTAVKTRPSESTVTPLRALVAGESTVASATAGSYIVGQERIPGSTGARPLVWLATSQGVLTGTPATVAAVTATGTAAGVLGDRNTGDAHAAVWPTRLDPPVRLPDVGTVSGATSISDDGTQVGGYWLAAGTGSLDRPVTWACR